MSDESTQFIVGDTAIDATAQGRRGSRRKKAERERTLTTCENCGAALNGAFCSQCGQHAIDYRRSLWRVLVDAADSFLNWDTKFLSSIGILLWRPWKLTNDFNAGRRARYVHPLRLYLLASIAFFLLAKLVNFTGFSDNRPKELTAEDRAEMDAALTKLAAPESGLDDQEREKVEAARAKLAETNEVSTPEDRVRMSRALGTLVAASVKRELKAKDHKKLDTALARIVDPTPSPSPPPEAKVNDETVPGNQAAVPPPAPSADSDLNVEFGPDLHGAKNPFEMWLETQIKDKIGKDGSKAKLFLDTLRSNIPTMMLCCVPLFALLLKLLYLGKRRFYVEHLVYALHIHTFAYVGVVVITVIGMALAQWSNTARALVVAALSCVMFVQVFLSIRRVYGQRWFFTTLKFLLGGVAYLIVLSIAVGMTAFVTLLLPSSV